MIGRLADGYFTLHRPPRFPVVRRPPLQATVKSERKWFSAEGGRIVTIKVGDVVITDDEAHWRIHSITSDGRRRSFVALHFSAPRALTGDVTTLTWSGTESAWRLSLRTLGDDRKG